jgi:hypothetical protein
VTRGAGTRVAIHGFFITALLLIGVGPMPRHGRR